jgi:4-diphosphocytidyl-2C-methyl-D-erythritol kinase
VAKRLKLTVRAHAKVNLDLRVLGVRADGYHELRTVFQSIELHDTLVCAERPAAAPTPPRRSSGWRACGAGRR